MTDIEQKYGKHTVLVDAFITHLESGNVDWDAVAAAWVATWGTFAASDAASDAASSAARVAAWDAMDAAWDAASSAARVAASGSASSTAGYAAFEIIGHELLAERDKPLIFLPMFGLDIEQLKGMAL